MPEATIVSSLDEGRNRLDELSSVGVGLARYAESLSPGGRFVHEGTRWVYRPDNFVTFSIQKRNPKFTLTLSGHSVQFKNRAERAGLEAERWDLEVARREYSRYTVAKPGQLLAAAFFIRCARDYKHRRDKKAV